MLEAPVIKRDCSIDLLKTIAVTGVVVIHTCIGGFAYPVGTFNWTAGLFWGSLTRASVPLFLMCSGALLLNPERELTIRKLYSKNMLRILAALLFWATAYKFFHLFLNRTLSLPYIIHALKEVLLFHHESHLYYLHIILLVYAFLPVTRLYVKNAGRQQLEYVLMLWFVLGIFYPTVNTFWPFTLLSGIPLQWLMNMTYASVGYGILGYYLKRYPLRGKGFYCAAALCGFALVFGGSWFMSLREGTLYQHFLEGMTVGVALLAAGIFGLCSSVPQQFSARFSAVLHFCSKASFCIYLVHIFFLHFFSALGFTVKILPCLVSIPVIVLANLLCSSCVYLILRKIPIVNKWLI